MKYSVPYYSDFRFFDNVDEVILKYSEHNDNIIDLGYLIFDFPLRFIFYLNKDIDLKDVTVQEDEVESVVFMSIDEIKENIEKGLMHKAHGRILEMILKYKNVLSKGEKFFNGRIK